MRRMKVSAGRSGVIRSAAVMSAVLLLTGCGGAASRLASHVQRGKAYFAGGDYSHASVEFRNAMQIAPKDRQARMLAAKAAEQLGQPREAAALYQSVMDLHADDTEARASLGRLFDFAGDPQHALDIVSAGLDKHPDDPALLTVRASARIQMKDDAGAVADVEHALRVAPANEDALALRAGLYQKAGDPARAVELISTALAHHPDSVDLHEVLSNLYLAIEEPAKAEEQLRALVTLRPGQLTFRKELALFLARAHRLDEAQRTLEKAVADLPADDEAKLALVAFVTSQRTAAEGEKILRNFITRQPDDFQLRFGLADLLRRTGSTAEALATYAEVIHRDETGPQGLLARDRIAAIYLTQNRADDARKLIKEVLDRNPHDNDALLMRGELGLRPDPAGAVADLRAVLRDQPGSVAVQRLLARAYIANGEPALAEQALRAAMEAAPADIPVRLELAQLLIRRQEPERATALLEDSVRKAPTDAAAREALTRVYLSEHNFAGARVNADALETLLPKAALGPYLAGLAAQGENRLDDSSRDFDRALSLQPRAMDALTALVRLELTRGRTAAAFARAQQAADQDAQDPIPYNLLAELYLGTKDFKRATEAAERAIAISPGWWAARRSLARVRLSSGDTAGALAAYADALKDAPSNAELVVEAALLYERQGKVDDAIARYETLRKLDPHSDVAANNLAVLLVTYRSDQHSLDEARDLTAAFASSENGTLLDTNGWVRFKRGDLDEALRTLERAVERAPDSKEIRYHLAMAQLETGQRDQARSNLESALNGSPHFAGADEARVTLARLRDNPSG